jgi:transposase
MFVAFSMLLIENEMTVSKVASALRVVPNRLWRVFNYWVGDAVSKDDLQCVGQVGIDETSSKKGHNYVTVYADLEMRGVVHVVRGRERVASLAKTLEQKGGKVENIGQVAIGMSPAYISGVMEYLPKAQIVFDKFYIMALLGKAMDELRKGRTQGAPDT